MRPALKVTGENRFLAFVARPGALVAAALAIGAAMMGYVAFRWSDDHARALAKFRQETESRNAEAAEAARFKMSLLYQGLRTIARLPSVQSIDRRASNLDADARRSIQELYNNLASSVDVSEVYITSADFNPDRIDPRTGNPEEPIIMFDELIVGRNADQDGRLRGAIGEDDAGTPSAHDTEIYEFRELQSQIGLLKSKYPAARSIKDLNYPAISSPELITCDNRFFSPSAPNDKDRAGIIYSVPFYGPEGRLRGIVSGVILTRNLHTALGGGGHVLENAATAFASGPVSTAAALFTIQTPVHATDERKGWSVRTPGLKAVYFARDDVKAADRMAVQGLGLALVLTLALLLAARMHGQFATRAIDREANLDAMIRARTAELNAKVNELEAHRSALEAARAEAIQASEAKSQFLANMSHELRTPLNAILGFSDLMHQEIRGPLGHSSYKGYAQDIHRSGAHLLSLINDILDLSKIEAGRFELHESVFNPHRAFQTAFKLLELRAAQAGVTLHNQVSPHIDLQGDERAMQQIALNLLTNAVKFTPSGGSVHAQSFLDADWLTLKIVDNGKGIAPDDLERVFENFGQGRHDHAVKDRGTGLGLPIVRGLIEAHGGDVRIKSQVGRGTAVVIRLPAQRVRPAAAAA
jgi:signal transduction histidine kinase